MNELSELRRAISDSRAQGLFVREIHVSRDFNAALWKNIWATYGTDWPQTIKIEDGSLFDGIPIKIADFEITTGFYLTVVPFTETVRATNDLREAMNEARASGLEVTEIHVSNCFYDDLYDAVLVLSRGVQGHTRMPRWFAGVPVRAVDFESAIGFYLLCAPRVPKEPPEEPVEPTLLFGYPVTFTDSPAFGPEPAWRATFRDVELSERANVGVTIVSALREETTLARCGVCPCLSGDTIRGYKCGAGYKLTRNLLSRYPRSRHCGMVAIVTREKSIIFNHKYND